MRPKYKGPLRFPIRFKEDITAVHVFYSINGARIRYGNKERKYDHYTLPEGFDNLNCEWFLKSTAFPVITKREARKINPKCP